MEKITTIADLNTAIHDLENKRAIDWLLLKEQFLMTAETLKPVNIVKGTFRELISSPESKVSLAKTAIGIATGLVATKFIVGKIPVPLANFLVSVLAGIGAKENNAPTIGGLKSIGSNFLKKMLHL
jgi:hypothetical protein